VAGSRVAGRQLGDAEFRKLGAETLDERDVAIVMDESNRRLIRAMRRLQPLARDAARFEPFKKRAEPGRPLWVAGPGQMIRELRIIDDFENGRPYWLSCLM